MQRCHSQNPPPTPDIRSAEPDTLVTPEVAADFLGKSPTTLAGWRSKKKYALPWMVVGGTVRYRVGDLREFVANGARSPLKDGAA